MASMRQTREQRQAEPVGDFLYFGCWDSVGHGYHRPDGSTPWHNRGDATDVTPWGWGVEKLSPHTMTQGLAALHQLDGWTALAVDDFTVDGRGNSKSVFLFHDTLDFDQALFWAAEKFPRIFKRVGPITEAGK